MQTKKNPKYDLEKLRVLIFNIAFVLALAIVTTAFEWGGYHDDPIDLVPEIEAIENQKANPKIVLEDPNKEEAIEIIVEMDFEEDEYTTQNDVWVKKK